MSKLPAEILKSFLVVMIPHSISVKTWTTLYLWQSYNYTHNRAFTVAKITKLDLLKDIQESLANAELEGIGFDEWEKNIKPTLAKKKVSQMW